MGYAVPEIIQAYWVDEEAKMSKTDEARRVVPAVTEKAPALGGKFSNPDVAKALRLIAEQGRDAFYKGEIAKGDRADHRPTFGGTMQLGRSGWITPRNGLSRSPPIIADGKCTSFHPTAKAWLHWRCSIS